MYMYIHFFLLNICLQKDIQFIPVVLVFLIFSVLILLLLVKKALQGIKYMINGNISV
jgi:hypothetical protein